MEFASSVIIPTHNRLETLRGTLGVVVEVAARSEIIVVADGCTDGTAAFVSGFPSDRVRLVQRPCGGISRARNSGAQTARGEVLLFLDDDDLPLKDWEKVLAAVPDECAGICCGADFVTPDGRLLRTRSPETLGPAFEGVEGLFLAGTFSVRKAVFDAIGGFLPDLQCSHGTEFSLRLLEYCVPRGLLMGVHRKPLVQITRRGPGDRPESSPEKLLSGVREILRLHGPKLQRDSRRYGDYLAIAGVSALRIGEIGLARSFLWKSFRGDPTVKRLLRVFGAYSPWPRLLWERPGRRWIAP